MQQTSSTDPIVPDGDTAEITVPPTAMRHPAGRGLADNLDVAGHDEVEHEAALRDSALRAPR